MENMKREIIEKTILSFKNRYFGMIDVFLALENIERNFHFGLDYEDVCVIIDEWCDNGLLVYNPEAGMPAFKLTEAALELESNYYADKGRS